MALARCSPGLRHGRYRSALRLLVDVCAQEHFFCSDFFGEARRARRRRD
jgi:hypothetical protein